MSESTRRRSDRVQLTIPLRMKGLDNAGFPFEIPVHTTRLNRHGARIYSTRRLSPGQIVRLVNPLRHREAEFRVVGPVSPPLEHGGEWGVECGTPDANIWGINFPKQIEKSEAKALLECHMCHDVAITRLSLVEVDVLETSGILSKPCKPCAANTPWGAVTFKGKTRRSQPTHTSVVSTHYAARNPSGPTFLSLDEPYPRQIFIVVVWGSNRAKFGEPEKTYRDEAACVTGKIKEYGGALEVVASEPAQIKVRSGSEKWRPAALSPPAVVHLLGDAHFSGWLHRRACSVK